MPFSPPPRPRDDEMKDSWSHGDDRKDRGRVDRGVARPRRSRSPVSRRPEGDRERERESKPRDRTPVKSRTISQHDPRPRERERDRDRERERGRERSRDRRRRHSRSPVRDSREEVRERNRGRELLDTRDSDKPKRSTTHRSPSSSKRRKTRSPSPTRSHHKRSRKASSRSRSRAEGGSVTSSRQENKRREPSPAPVRKRSSERRLSDTRSEGRPRHHREPAAATSERRNRSPSPRRNRIESHRESSSHRRDSASRRHRSPPREPREAERKRERSPLPSREKEIPRERERERRERSPQPRRRSPVIDRYEPASRSRHTSPGAPTGPRGSLVNSPRRERGGRPSRIDEYRPSNSKDRGPKFPGASGANSIEVKGSRLPPGSNSEADAEKMNGQGYYGGQQPGYPNNNPMAAAFPLKQYNQPMQIDPRQYSQSPQHIATPGSHHGSYHGSPQAQSPYAAGRGNWGGQQQQYSPQPQYPQNYQQPQQSYAQPPTGPQAQYYNNQAQSPPYQAPTGPMNQNYQQQNFRGGRGNYRGNNFIPRGGRGDYRGGRGGHYANPNFNANITTGVGRGQHNSPGNVTPQHASPQPPYPSQHNSNQGTPQHAHPPVEEEDAEDLFRPSKELRVEDKDESKKKDEEQMPPPSRPIPTGPQSQQNSSKFSFAFKGPSKTTPTTPKPEISQKLNAGPARAAPPVQTSPDRSRGAQGRGIPTEPASARRQDFRSEPPAPTTRKVKKIMKRAKPRPTLEDDFRKSESVYYRKPGNESVVGSGTYGKVFKAIHVYTKSLVALKKIRMEGERDGFPVTAVREIKLLQSLKHANIVNMKEVMVEKNDCFMVFEYLSHDLTGLLNHPSFKLEPAHKKHLAKQMFEGLDYLHRRGVLHRDIKAANILVSNEGQLKLADFGLARFYAKRRQLDYTNRVITIWYRSPELLLGETQYGPAVDIWSAACVLVEIFTRHAIFPGDGGEISQLEKIYAVLGTPTKADWPGLVDMAWFELLRPIAKKHSVFADKYRERVTPHAFELLEAMFQYDPAKRPSASDVLEHPYFTTEAPEPRQAVELAQLEGDWHEFESKALRKENERKDKEARRQAQSDAKAKMGTDKDKKRGPEGEVAERDPKRVQIAAHPAEVAISKIVEMTG